MNPYKRGGRKAMTDDEWRAYRREYEREYRKRPKARIAHCEYMRKWRAKNPEKVKEYHKKYNEANRVKQNQSLKKWRESHRLATRSHKIFNRAIRSGKIIKADKCSKCNSGEEIHGHHPDYIKPLEVIWLCKKCHANLHRRNYER